MRRRLLGAGAAHAPAVERLKARTHCIRYGFCGVGGEVETARRDSRGGGEGEGGGRGGGRGGRRRGRGAGSYLACQPSSSKVQASGSLTERY